MFKKTIAALLLSVSALCLTAANGMKTLKLSNETFAVKAGTVITFEAEFEADPDYVLAGWAANIIRKNSAPEFFAKPEMKIRKHPKDSNYDVITFSPHLRFPVPQTKGKFTGRINTSGMPVGDYAISIQGHWMQGKKSTYPGATLYVSITEADNAKFATTPQEIPLDFMPPRTAAPTPKWCQKVQVSPNPITIQSGSKVSFTCDYEALAGESYGGHLVLVFRRSVPAKFFEVFAAKVNKNPKLPEYDRIILLPFKHSANQPGAKIAFDLDTTNYPTGIYDVYIQFRIVKADGKTAYANYPIALTVK